MVCDHGYYQPPTTNNKRTPTKLPRSSAIGDWHEIRIKADGRARMPHNGSLARGRAATCSLLTVPCSSLLLLLLLPLPLPPPQLLLPPLLLPLTLPTAAATAATADCRPRCRRACAAAAPADSPPAPTVVHCCARLRF